MKKLLCISLICVLIFALCACGQKTETIEITMDNWDEYFEFRTVTRWEENAFGETSMVEYPMALCVKEAYEDRIVMDQADLAIECSWTENDRIVTVDWKNRAIHFGEVVNPYDVQTRTDRVTEILCWEDYDHSYIVVYMRDLGVSKETLLTNADGNTYALSIEDGKIIRIQGTIVVTK